MNYGCLFTSLKFNILCYADDIALIAPSSFGLQQLIDRLCSLLTELDLKINNDICAVLKSIMDTTIITYTVQLQLTF